MSLLMPLLGGALIGLAASILLLANRRVAGISGIVAGLLGSDAPWRGLFIAGLLVAGLVAVRLDPRLLQFSRALPAGAVIVSGLLVGFGTRLGNGCTSGHGVC